jgi:NitT/TauT family transport system permease protein
MSTSPTVAPPATEIARGQIDPVNDLPRTTSGEQSWRRLALGIAPIVGVLLPLLAWQAYVKIADVKQIVLPAPWDVLEHLWSDPGFYFDNARPTLWEALVGFVIGFVIALAWAIVLAHSRFLERAAMPWIILLQVTPLIAYAPALVIWRGLGFQSVVLITAICCFVPFLVNGIIGLRSVDPNLLELSRSVDASRREVLLHLRLPSALPNLFSGARIAIGMALMGAVLGEFFGGVSSGLGFAIKVGQQRALTLQLWGSVFVLAFLGSLAISLLTLVERFVLHWHASQRN